MKHIFKLRVGISIVAALLIAVRIWKPDLKIDTITLGLLIVVLLPWLASLLESAKFPGGWEVRFRDLEAAANKVMGEDSGDVVPTKGEPSRYSQEDPNLALVGLRIDVERQLRALSRQHGLEDSLPLHRLLRELESNGKIADSAAGGLKKIIDAGNQAAHGARVELDVADWAIKSAPRIIAALGGTPCARCQQPAVVNGKCSKCGFLHDGD
jgi:hypothetical protein